MDKLTQIQTAIETALSQIGSVIDGTYTYYNDAGQIGNDDQALNGSLNSYSDKINHVVALSEDGEELEEMNTGQNVYTYSAIFEVESYFQAPFGSNPIREMTNKCNSIISDIKYVVGQNHTLSQLINYMEPINFSRETNGNGDIISGMTLRSKLRVNYSQAITDPNITAC